MSVMGGLDSSKIIVIDTETTGLNPGSDEVLSLAIIDGDGNVLFDDFMRPARRKRWPKAAEINGITWSDVKDKGTLLDRGAEILPLFENASLVVGYNVQFDLGMLEGNGLALPERNVYDVMKWHAIKNGGRKVRLAQCASHYGYGFEPHNALEDAKATLHCFKSMVGNTNALAGVGAIKVTEEKKRSILWLALAVASFILAAILGICLNTAETMPGVLRGIFWTVLFLAVGVFCVFRWRRK